MNKIFWGLIFLFADININGINILPSFVGYILIFLGLNGEELRGCFDQIRPWAIAGAVFSAVTWLPILELGLLGSAVGAALQLVVTHFIAGGVAALEGLHGGADLGAARLEKAWTVMAMGFVLSLVMSWLFKGLAVVPLIVSWAAAVVYMVVFYRCKKNL